jgi:hypothetical protein
MPANSKSYAFTAPPLTGRYVNDVTVKTPHLTTDSGRCGRMHKAVQAIEIEPNRVLRCEWL